MYNTLLVFLALCLAATNGQRTVPGVPPQNYQEPPQQYQQHQQQQQYQQHAQNNLPPGISPQQYQQQQMHQQQQMQYQQVPAQQQPPVQQIPVHQQVPVQQVPQGHVGGHQASHGHHGQKQVLNTANIQHEREHIQEHMQVPIDTSKMSEAELQFHYFKMHDSDNNNKLDGCELIKSLIHWHAKDEGTKEENAENKDTKDETRITYTDEKLSQIVDHVMKTMDFNNDGYVDYIEYRKSEEDSDKAKMP